MNQIRNLWTNVLSNIAIIFGWFYLINNVIFPDTSDIGTVILNNTLPSILALLIIFLCASIPSKLDDVRLVPPLGFFILVYILWNYLSGNMKIIRSLDYAYIGRYYDNKIYVYNFRPFYFTYLDKFSYNGTEDSIVDLKLNLKRSHDNLVVEPDSVKNSFKNWDGTVDPESKRINTIDKIIKS